MTALNYLISFTKEIKIESEITKNKEHIKGLEINRISGELNNFKADEVRLSNCIKDVEDFHTELFLRSKTKNIASGTKRNSSGNFKTEKNEFCETEKNHRENQFEDFIVEEESVMNSSQSFEAKITRSENQSHCSIIQPDNLVNQPECSVIQQYNTANQLDYSKNPPEYFVVQQSCSEYQPEYSAIQAEYSVNQQECSTVETENSMNQQECSVIEPDCSVNRLESSVIQSDNSVSQEDCSVIQPEYVNPSECFVVHHSNAENQQNCFEIPNYSVEQSESPLQRFLSAFAEKIFEKTDSPESESSDSSNESHDKKVVTNNIQHGSENSSSESDYVSDEIVYVGNEPPVVYSTNEEKEFVQKILLSLLADEEQEITKLVLHLIYKFSCFRQNLRIAETNVSNYIANKKAFNVQDTLNILGKSVLYLDETVSKIYKKYSEALEKI